MKQNYNYSLSKLGRCLSPRLILLLLLILTCRNGFAQTEGNDFPNSLTTDPAFTFVLKTGANTFSGAVDTPSDGQDNWQIVLPSGMEITSIQYSIQNNNDISKGFFAFGLNQEVLVQFPSNFSGTVNSSAFFSKPGTYSAATVADMAESAAWSVVFNVVEASNNAPTNILLMPGMMTRNGGINGRAGRLQTTDADSGDTHTYSLVAGEGDTDNSSFNIALQGSYYYLLANDASSLSPGDHSVRVSTSDGIDTFEKALTVHVAYDLKNFSWSSTSDLPNATGVSYTFNYQIVTPNPTNILYVYNINGWELPFLGLSANNYVITDAEEQNITVKVNGVERAFSARNWGSNFVMIKLDNRLVASDSQIQVTIDNVTNKGAGTYYWSFINTASDSGNAIDEAFRPAPVVLWTPTAPSLETSSAYSITSNSAILGGKVTNDGGATVTERGIVFNTGGNPSILDNKVQIGDGIGSFSEEISGLDSETTYYVKAYAVNDVGVEYGSQKSFTTTTTTTTTTDGYCYPSYSNQGYYWMIKALNISENSFSYSINNYEETDHTSEIIPVNAGGEYTFQISTDGWIGVGVAADFNNDGDFDDVNEILAPSTYEISDEFTYSYTISLPSEISTGDYRLRLWNAGGNSGPGDSPCGNYVYGTYADFTLSVGEANAAPEAVCQNFTAQLGADGTVTLQAADVDGGSSDAEGDVTLSLDKEYIFDCSDVEKEILVTLIVTDSDGATDTCTATVIVQDSIAPTIACPSGFEVNNDPGIDGAIVEYNIPLASDNCTSENTIINGSFEQGDYSGWTILSSNSSCGSFLIAEDGESFTAGMHYDYADNVNESQYSPNLPFDIAATDGQYIAVFLQNCSSTHRMYQDLHIDPNSVLKFDLGYNNTSQSFDTANQFIAVVIRDVNTDNTLEILYKTESGDPLSIPLTEFSFDLSAYGNQEVRLEIIQATINQSFFDVFLDNIRIEGLVINQTSGLPSGSEFPVGTTTNTFEVTDASGNKSTCSFDVTVIDAEAPTGYTVSIDHTEIDENNEASVSFTFANAEVGTTYNYTFTSDNGGTEVTGSGTVSTATDQITGIDISGLEDGIISLSVTLTDASLNEGTAATANVLKDTNDAPVAVCKAFTAQLGADGTVTIEPADVDGGSTDDKAGFTLSIDKDTFGCTNIGTNEVVLRITDSDNVSTTCTAIVTVEDNVAPEVVTQNITVSLDENGQAVVSPDQIDNGSTDKCGIASIEFSHEIAYAEIPEGQMLTITLPAGQVVESVDFASYGTPTGSNGSYTIGSCHASNSMSIVESYALGENSFTISSSNSIFGDPCEGITKRLYVAVKYGSNKIFTCDDIGDNPVMLTVVDNNGNEATATATVTVIDEIAPVVTTKDITVQLDANGEASIVPADIVNTSTDNCGVESYSLNINNFTCEDIENPINHSLNFAATNGYTITEDASIAISGSTAMTLEGWVYPKSSGNYQFLMGYRNDTDADFYMLQMPGNTIEARYRNADGTMYDMNVGSLSLNEWQHLALSFDGTNLTLYVNGEIVNSIAAAGNFKVSDIEKFFMGGIGNFYFSGNLEDVRLWNEVRTQNEIQFAMNTSIPGAEEALAINYGFADGAGSIVTDQSGNNLNADFINMDETSTWVEESPTSAENIVVLTVMDVNGNVASTTATVTVVDLSSPVLTAETNQDVVVDANCSITVPDLVDGSSATDNCTVTITQSPVAGTVISSEHNGTVDVVVTVTDASGNKDESTVVLTAKDETEPVLTAEANQDVVLDAACAITVPNLVDGSNATDNCIATITQSPEAGTVVTSSHNGTVDVVVTATDAAGNIAESTVILTAKDVTDPVLTAAANQDVVLDAACSITVPNLVDGSSATDNCAVTITQSPEAGTVVTSSHNGTVDVVVTATDAAGNTAESTVILTAKDVTDPILTAEADQDVVLDAACSITVPNLVDGSSATDNCTATITQSPEAGTVVSTEHNGTVDVVVTVTDAAGNKAETTVVLTAKDETAPVLTAEADQNVVLDAACSITVPNLVDGSSVIENCTATIVQSPEAGTVVSTEHNGTVDVEVIAADVAGNTVRYTVVLTAKDETAPILTAEANQDVNLEDTCSITVPNLVDGSNATDNCTVTITQSPEAGTVVTSSHNGTVDVVVTATDAAGNKDESTVVLTAKDVTDPILTAEADQDVVLDAACSITVPNLVDGSSATDNCTATITQSPEAGTLVSTEHDGIFDVVVTVTDAAGNKDESTVILTAKDETVPVLTAEANQDVVLDAACSITVPNLVDGSSAIDNCTVSITQSPEAGTVVSSEHNGTVDVVVTATDAAGNKDESTVVLTAKDETTPVLTAEADQDVDLDEFCSITVPDVVGTVTDNCTVSVIQSPEAGTIISSKIDSTVDVVVTATDGAGNTVKTTVVLTAKDKLSPVPVMENLETVTAECSVEEGDVNIPIAVDNCDGAVNVTHDVNFPITTQGTTVITWTYKDESGNTSTQTQEVLIKDETAPVPDLAELQDIVVQCEVSSIAAPTATDICAGSLTATTTDALSYDEQGEYTITWTYDDGNGNKTSQTQKVIVEDTTAPVVITKNITVFLDPVENVSITAADIDGGTTDNCSDVSLSISQDYFDASGVYEVVLTATDEVGNTASATAIVTVEVDGVETNGAHVVPTTLTQSSVAKVILPFRSKIMEVQVLEAETGRYKSFRGNESFEMEINVAPFKGTLLVRILDETGKVYQKKLVAL